jgi:transcriptional regulator with XRE-family HTH domain
MNPHKEGLNGAVADVLRGLQSRERMTQADLAERSGIPLVSVQRYLACTRPIDLEVLAAFARALGTTPHDVTLEAAVVLRDRQRG